MTPNTGPWAKRVRAELKRMKVDIETLPSGASRLRKGGNFILVADLRYISEEDFATFAGRRTQMPTLSGEKLLFND